MSHLFIFGEQRTGSTLIHTLLRKHPQITATPNDFNLVYLYKKGLKIFPHNKDLIKFMRWGFGDLFSLSNRLKKFKRADTIKYIIDTYFKDSKELIKVHKTPKGEHELEYYREAFNEAFFLYTIRNPLGILASRKHWELINNWKNLEGAGVTFERVKEALDTIRTTLNRLFKSYKIIDENYWCGDTLGIIPYEQFVLDPVPILRDLFKRLEINNEEKIIKELFNISGPYTSYKDLKSKKGVYGESINRWEIMLTDFEKYLIYNEFKSFVNSYKFKSTQVEKVLRGYLNE